MSCRLMVLMEAYPKQQAVILIHIPIWGKNLGDVAGKNVVIVGDISSFWVALSNIFALRLQGQM